jgi:rRNA maturation protein Nop10
MKRCPSCERTYTDDALSFCPNDGTPLVTDTPSSFDPQATIMASPPKVSGPFDQPSGPTDWPSQPPPPVSDWSTPQPPAQPQQTGWGDAPGSYTPGSQMTGGTGWQAPPPPPFPGGGQKQQGLAVGSLVCGILSIFCCWLGLLPGITAIILGVISMNKEKSDPANYGGRGLAMGGVITGGIGTLISVGWIILNIISAIAR